MSNLLTRDQFRVGVFARDSHKCVVCGNPAQDAHHIIERRLFSDGGYYLDNGASLCGDHHIAAEQTIISPEDIRRFAGITKLILPEHLYRDQPYDKWGNPILPNGQRLRGELFYDESVQKILKSGGVLDLFSKYVKYPRTYHLPWSSGITKDDRVIADCSQFEGKEVVITRKMDGENTTLYNDYMHARSLEFESHESRHWAKTMWGRIAHDIPESFRLCCENMYAQHSIHYEDLEGWLLLFSVWENSTCLSWDDTVMWGELLGLPMVPVVYRGPWNELKAKYISYAEVVKGSEGIVVRVADAFDYSQFRNSVAKFVRQGHVQTHGHWMRQRVVPNKLKS